MSQRRQTPLLAKLAAMRLFFFILAALSVCVTVEGQKKKAPDVQILENKARRGENTIRIDIRLRIAGEKPIKGLMLHIDFQGADGGALTTEKAGAEEEVLKPGDEASIRTETANPPGSIKYKILAFDGGGRELAVGNAGPFIIE